MAKTFLEWVAKLDGVTTIICLDAHGQVVETHELFVTMAGSFSGPPAHWGCRSVIDIRTYLVSKSIMRRDPRNEGRRYVRSERREGKRHLARRRREVGREKYRNALDRAGKSRPPPGVSYIQDVRAVGPRRISDALADELGRLRSPSPPTLDHLEAVDSSVHFTKSGMEDELARAGFRDVTIEGVQDIETFLPELRPGSPENLMNPGEIQNWHDNEKIAGWIEEAATEAGYDDVNDYVEMVRNAWKEGLNEMKVATRTTQDALFEILEDGRFKSQFEMGQSRGLFNPDLRGAVENRLFDYPMDLTDSQRPIYGYMENMNDLMPGNQFHPLAQYGDVRVIFRDSIKNRSSFVGSDSMSVASWLDPEGVGAFVASPVYDPHPGSIIWHDLSGYIDKKEILHRLVDPRVRQIQYIEAQIHEQVKIEDIEEVLFDSQPSIELTDFLDRQEILWRVLG